MKYIAYGSNMVREQMAVRCPDAKLIGTGYIERAKLEFFLHATVVQTRRRADRVPVAVWEISVRDEKRLDRYEGFPRYYIKQEWPVTLDGGEQVKGMIYLMNTIRKAPPACEYYNGIFNAYNALGLSCEIEAVLEPALRRALSR